MLCRPYSAGILHSVSDQMQNLLNYFTTPNKMTSENDIKGLVSLKFLRPWVILYMQLDIQNLFGLLCTHWLRPRNPLPPPAFGRIYEGAVGQPR